jgi:hypothetical protein
MSCWAVGPRSQVRVDSRARYWLARITNNYLLLRVRHVDKRLGLSPGGAPGYCHQNGPFPSTDSLEDERRQSRLCRM